MSFSFRGNKTLNVGAQLKISFCLAKCNVNAVSVLSKTVINSLSGSSTCSLSLGIRHFFFRMVLNLNELSFQNTVRKAVVIIYILLDSLHC